MDKSKVRVAIIDDSVSSLHIPLIFNYKIDDNGVCDNNSQDQNEKSHGTMCANIILKYNSEVEIGCVSIIHNMIGNKEWLIKAIDLCVKHKVDVINLSIGSTNIFDIESVREKIRSTKNIVFVCAQNNGGVYTVPGSLPDVVSVKCDRYYSGRQFTVENEFNIRASSLHNINGENTRICNSYATPLITAVVSKILENTRNYDLFFIYRQLFKHSNKSLYESADRKNDDVPKICIVDKDYRFKSNIKRLVDIFLSEGYTPLLMSGSLNKVFDNTPYFTPIFNLQYIERQLYFTLAAYSCDIVVCYLEEVPEWTKFDIVIYDDIMNVYDVENHNAIIDSKTERLNRPEDLFNDIKSVFNY